MNTDYKKYLIYNCLEAIEYNLLTFYMLLSDIEMPLEYKKDVIKRFCDLEPLDLILNHPEDYL